MRTIIDVLIALLLAAVLLWCGFLFWGAYSQHRLAILVNGSVLNEMKDAIANQTSGVSTDLTARCTQEIDRLKEAQEQLFDANTISFIFQFVSLLLITVGASVLAFMYSHYRREQERAENAEKAAKEAVRALPLFIKGRNTTAVLASKYCLLYTLSQFFRTINKKERETVLIIMMDYQGDIQRHLEDALREKEGLEPELHEVVLDMADRVKRTLFELINTTKGAERAFIKRMHHTSSLCRDILWANGREFVDRYKKQWTKIRG